MPDIPRYDVVPGTGLSQPGGAARWPSAGQRNNGIDMYLAVCGGEYSI
jgi:hypothetical protein